jgi:hypothetical protein
VSSYHMRCRLGPGPHPAYHCEMSSTSIFSVLKMVMTEPCKKPNASLLLLGRMNVSTCWTARNLCFTAFLSLGGSWPWSHSFQWSNQPRPGRSWFGVSHACLCVDAAATFTRIT